MPRRHPFMTSTWRGGVQTPCGRKHRKLKIESTDVILSSSHAKNFLLLCVQSIQSIHLKLDLRPTCSATHIPLVIDCKAPSELNYAVELCLSLNDPRSTP